MGHTSDPNIASFLGAHESNPDLFTSINVEDEILGGSFHTTPPRSTQVPPVGPTSGGAEDLATLTALSSLVFGVETPNTRSMKVVDRLKTDKEEEEEQDLGSSQSNCLRCFLWSCPTGPFNCFLLASTTVPTIRYVPAVLKTIPASSDVSNLRYCRHQRKRQQEVLASAANYSDAAWDIILAPQHNCFLTSRRLDQEEALGRKCSNFSQSTIPIEEGDPEAEHKVCIKYASNADSASDDDTPVNLYAVVDWELLPTGLGSINVFYRPDNSRKY
ncbi:hypothetical protein Tco_0411537 [Tanacetum coccineum]